MLVGCVSSTPRAEKFRGVRIFQHQGWKLRKLRSCQYGWWIPMFLSRSYLLFIVNFNSITRPKRLPEVHLPRIYVILIT